LEHKGTHNFVVLCNHWLSAISHWKATVSVKWSCYGPSYRSTQPCIPPGSLNQVPTSAGGKGGILTYAEWYITLCDPIWH